MPPDILGVLGEVLVEDTEDMAGAEDLEEVMDMGMEQDMDGELQQ